MDDILEGKILQRIMTNFSNHFTNNNIIAIIIGIIGLIWLIHGLWTHQNLPKKWILY